MHLHHSFSAFVGKLQKVYGTADQYTFLYNSMERNVRTPLGQENVYFCGLSDIHFMDIHFSAIYNRVKL